jgi:hypothetical protein
MEPFGALYTPPGQTRGRWANPNLYALGYYGLTPEGAVAETFGQFAKWSAPTFEHPDADTVRALSVYDLPDDTTFVDLNDPAQLVDLGVDKVTDVIERDLERTQALAQKIHQAEKWDGIQWWSYYHPSIRLIATWKTDGLTVVDTEPLTVDHPAVQEAAGIIVRHID